jgi:hypothetical protein
MTFASSIIVIVMHLVACASAFSPSHLTGLRATQTHMHTCSEFRGAAAKATVLKNTLNRFADVSQADVSELSLDIAFLQNQFTFSVDLDDGFFYIEEDEDSSTAAVEIEEIYIDELGNICGKRNL